MRDEIACRGPGKPNVQMKRRRLHIEGRNILPTKIECDRVIWRGADRRRNAGKRRERGSMNVAGRDQSCAGMAPHDLGHRISIAQILLIHVPDAGQKWRMVEEDESGPAG